MVKPWFNEILYGLCINPASFNNHNAIMYCLRSGHNPIIYDVDNYYTKIRNIYENIHQGESKVHSFSEENPVARINRKGKS